MQGLKGVLEIQGVASRTTAPPIQPFSDDRMLELKQRLQQLVPKLEAAGVANPGQVIA